jgi:phosphomannomutase
LFDPNKSMKKIIDHYMPLANSVCELDGYSLTFDTWRFNLRSSNTEPLIRLNVETNGDRVLLESKLNEISRLLNEPD